MTTNAIILTESHTTCSGREAVEVFRLAALIGALKLEQKGLRLSRHVSALKIAKGLTGLKGNDRAKHVARLEIMLENQKRQVIYVDERAAPQSVQS